MAGYSTIAEVHVLQGLLDNKVSQQQMQCPSVWFSNWDTFSEWHAA